MKVEVNKVEKSDGIEFPLLMISSDGSIILAFEFNENGNINGAYLNDSDSCFQDEFVLEAFKPFNGTITLSND